MRIEQQSARKAIMVALADEGRLITDPGRVVRCRRYGGELDWLLGGSITWGQVMIRFNCAGCDASISAPDGAAGKRGKCVKCGQSNMVPTAAQPSVLTKPKQPIAIKPPAAVLPAKVEVMPPEPAILTPPPPPPMIVQVVAPPAAVQVNQRVYVQASATNGLGTAGFVCSLLGILTCGLLSPIGLLFSVLGIFRAPRGMAFAGGVLGAFGSVWLVLVGGSLILGFIGLSEAAKQMQREVEKAGQEQQRQQAREVPLTNAIKYRPLDSYSVGDRMKRGFLVPLGTTPASLIPLAKQLHAAHPDDTLHFFDDDEKYTEYVDWDKHYAGPSAADYLCPEEWAEAHFVASANEMIGEGWGLWGGWSGEKKYAALE